MVLWYIAGASAVTRTCYACVSADSNVGGVGSSAAVSAGCGDEFNPTGLANLTCDGHCQVRIKYFFNERSL